MQLFEHLINHFFSDVTLQVNKTSKNAKQTPEGVLVAFRTSSHLLEFFRNIPPDFLLEFRGFTTVSVQRDQERTKDNKRNSFVR